MTKGQRQESHSNGMVLLGGPAEKREGIRAIQSDYRDKLFRLRQDIGAKSGALNAIMLKAPAGSHRRQGRFQRNRHPAG